jgi:hypothetical protein
MESNLIEKYDRSRINLLIGAAISWSIFEGYFISRNLIGNPTVKNILKIIGLLAFVFFFYTLVRIIRIKRIMKKNPDLKNALENEWVIQNRKKAYTIGFWVMLISLVIGLYLVLLTHISAALIIEIIMYIGVLALMITFIVLNKRE